MHEDDEEDQPINAEDEEDSEDETMEEARERKKEPKESDAGSWKLTDSAWKGAKIGLGPKKSRWGPSESSWRKCEWEKSTSYSWKPRSHRWDNMQSGSWCGILKTVEGVWEDGDSAHHEIKLQSLDPLVRWICTPRQRNNLQRIQDKAVSIDYNACDGMCWWGVGREYFFDPSGMKKNCDQMCWYSHSDWNNSWPAFTWSRVRRPFASWSQQQLEHNAPASGQKADASGVTKVVDATGNDSCEGVEASGNTTSNAGGGFNRHIRATPLRWVPRVRPS